MRRAQNDSEFIRPPEEFPLPEAQSAPLPPEFGSGGGDAVSAKKKKKYHWLAAVLAAGLLSTVSMFSDAEKAIQEPFALPTPQIIEALMTAAPTPTADRMPSPSPVPTALPIPTPTASPKPTPTASPKPTPTPAPIPGVKLTFYRTSQVYHGTVVLEAQDRMDAVTVRLWDPVLKETVWEYPLTAEEIAQGRYGIPDFDLSASEFAQKHWDQLMSCYEPVPVLEVSYTARTDDGEKTFTEQAEVVEEPWINLRYDLKDPEQDVFHTLMGNVTYPDCFVVRIEQTSHEGLQIRYGEPDVLSPGDVCVTLTVDGRPIPAETCRLEVVPQTMDGQILYAYAFVMPRPDDFPEHGSASVKIVQKLLHFDQTATRTLTIEY